jgi:LPXTG-site transpeptidase (sortase) family protein
MMVPRSVGEARRAILLGLAGALLVLAGIVGGDLVSEVQQAARWSAPVELPRGVEELPASDAGASTSSAPVPGRDVVRRRDPARGAPIRLVAETVGIDAAVDPVVVDEDAVLRPPSDVSRVGWWQDGAKPGSRLGTVLLTGHTYSGGDGVFDELGRLATGDEVRVRTATGVVTYRVDAVEDYSKAQLADIAPRLFSDSVRSQLVLVTCTDLDRGEYHGNAVVVAHPCGTSRRYID